MDGDESKDGPSPSVRPAAQALTELPAHVLAVFVGPQADRMDAMGGQFLVAVLGVAGDADRANDLTVLVADLHAAAFGEDLVAADIHQVAHEGRLLLVSDAHELGRATERQRRISLAGGHLEPEHRGAVLLL